MFTNEDRRDLAKGRRTTQAAKLVVGDVKQSVIINVRDLPMATFETSMRGPPSTWLSTSRSQSGAIGRVDRGSCACPPRVQGVHLQLAIRGWSDCRVTTCGGCIARIIQQRMRVPLRDRERIVRPQ